MATVCRSFACCTNPFVTTKRSLVLKLTEKRKRKKEFVDKQFVRINIGLDDVLRLSSNSENIGRCGAIRAKMIL